MGFVEGGFRGAIADHTMCLLKCRSVLLAPATLRFNSLLGFFESELPRKTFPAAAALTSHSFRASFTCLPWKTSTFL